MRRGATPAAGNGSQGRRERILEAAAQVFRKQGYDASMDDIAAEADVAKQTLYRLFNRPAVFRIYPDPVRKEVIEVHLFHGREGMHKHHRNVFCEGLRGRKTPRLGH